MKNWSHWSCLNGDDDDMLITGQFLHTGKHILMNTHMTNHLMSLFTEQKLSQTQSTLTVSTGIQS